jgi:hypothetical protein
MMKPFLLIAGDQYYPERATGDWVATFATEEEAKAEVSLENKEFGFRSKLRPPDRRTKPVYKIRGREYDWYEIVDLQPWIL